MPDRSNLVYRYDGSYQGFLCCVAECFTDKALPQGVQLLDEPQGTLFGIKAVDTDNELAARVERSLSEKISPLPRAGTLCERAFSPAWRRRSSILYASY